ncbi:MAG: B12-binding domain-containing radical SAM protein [Deltaproteobacteria bacterium]|nr:B12-binding domain-containing radical SAM protein [Deltaproteobacteria bacterium]
MHKPIVLATLNSSYFHASFGLRYLYANMGELQAHTELVEYTIAQKSHDLAEDILSRKPKILGLGVYIWNIRETYELVSILKRVQPNLVIVLGGPEVSYETETQSIFQKSDYTICGEAEFLFPELCKNILNHSPPSQKKIIGSLPEISKLKFPYEYYSNADITTRVVYVEASRGCPYKCEFCLSSLDTSVRSFDLDLFLGEMQKLLDRGVKQFKFVDRTFNLSIPKSRKILEFFLAKIDLGLFLHFELVPDRLPEELKEIIKQFPKGALQFEIGVQTWSPKVARIVSRRQDYTKVIQNFEFLVRETGVHIHSDLIAGLPGEDLESFGIGFDALAALEPHEIQLGILKRLKGTPIIRHDQEWEMLYQEHPPYQILKTKEMSFEIVLKLTRMAKFWDLIANSGNFKNSMKLLKELSQKREKPSLFWEFWQLSDLFNRRHPQRYGISLLNQVESVWVYLVEERGVEKQIARLALILDYTQNPSRDIPIFLREDTGTDSKIIQTKKSRSLPLRQARHLSSEINVTIPAN